MVGIQPRNTIKPKNKLRMVRVNKDILAKYNLFEELHRNEKVLSNHVIILGHKKNNSRWLMGSSPVSHLTVNEEIVFIVEQSKRDSKYGFKLRCEALTNEPFFRFDSDGPAHRNSSSKIPLDQQSISTPHFNTYDSQGKLIAYKGSILEKEKEAKAIVEDINFGASMFFLESNTILPNGSYPNISEIAMALNFEGTIMDTNFDQIDFT